jgi:hypothetical protein
MTTMQKSNHDGVLEAWRKSLSRADTDTLDTLIRRACRWFNFSLRDEETVAALESGRKSEKVYFILGFDPIMKAGGLNDFLMAAARRDLIEVPPSLQDDPDAAPRQRKPAATTQMARARKGEPRFANRFEVRIEGRPARLAAALGYRRVVEPDTETVLAKRRAFTVVADANGVRVSRIGAASLPAATRYLRRRLADQKGILRRARVVPAGGGEMIREDLMGRAHVHETGDGFAIDAN